MDRQSAYSNTPTDGGEPSVPLSREEDTARPAARPATPTRPRSPAMYRFRPYAGLRQRMVDFVMGARWEAESSARAGSAEEDGDAGREVEREVVASAAGVGVPPTPPSEPVVADADGERLESSQAQQSSEESDPARTTRTSTPSDPPFRFSLFFNGDGGRIVFFVPTRFEESLRNDTAGNVDETEHLNLTNAGDAGGAATARNRTRNGGRVDMELFLQSLQQIFEQALLPTTTPHTQGHPPAAPSVIHSLPLITPTPKRLQKHPVCIICQENFSLHSSSHEHQQPLPSPPPSPPPPPVDVSPPSNQKSDADTRITRLPCYHYYHRSCITQWLETSGTCPTCRYEFMTENEEYNQVVERRMKGWRVGEGAETDDEGDGVGGVD
ncbi:uncharacterized protein EV422DRAFT_510941 [Fimicolochytrium jonesii]|uniref:uncharacterized protein n=1 Tax=Fimicolochytrium jonesii TaxID=1396493 RepID=UPI0022FE4720|nr:uncharacterized protein EV422DRAFT_510941 [Fimicolochytrium jonesii]KAI8826642.1 hypothetical protein EV422DRAFT_510941 [Fimicolochytrium jonesii]